MILTILIAGLAAALGYEIGSLTTEARCWETIREHEDASNQLTERLKSLWREDV